MCLLVPVWFRPPVPLPSDATSTWSWAAFTAVLGWVMASLEQSMEEAILFVFLIIIE